MPFVLTILLAEAATLGHATAHGLIQERFFDTLLGCLVGLLGAVALHNPVFRRVGSRLLRQLILKQPPLVEPQVYSPERLIPQSYDRVHSTAS